MTFAGLSLLVSCLGALFSVHTFPLPGASAMTLLVDADSDGSGDILLLDGDKVIIHLSTKDYAPVSISLAKGTTAFDIVDCNADGRNEVVAICGDRVQRYDIPAEGEGPAPRDLFQCRTTLGDLSGHPFPQVMAIKRDGRPLLALPCAEGVEVHALDGALVEKLPIRDEVRVDTTWLNIRQFFSGRDLTDGAGLDFNVSIAHKGNYVNQPPDDLMPASLRPNLRSLNRWGRPGGPDTGVQWWFPLKTNGSTLLRAWCETHWRHATTDLRVSEARSEADLVKNTPQSLGPSRRYPGLMVCDNYIPDFNHDGYTDIVLWKAPMPGMSVDSMTRAVTGGTWPVEIVVHFFAPEKKRFEPVPAARLSLTVPINFFLEHYPIQNEVFRDFDGDGRMDIALSNTKQGFGVWLFVEKGISNTPDFEQSFGERIEKVEFAEDLDGKGRTSVALRGKRNLYLLHAGS